MTAEYPNGYPNTYLTLSAEPHTDRENTGSPHGLIWRHSRDRRLKFILAGIRSGAYAADVARAVGISRERVRQIWVAATGTPLPQRGPMPRRDLAGERIRRFWSRVSVHPSGCWLWMASRYPTGYGSASAHADGSPRKRGVNGYAHRVAYEMLKGPIPVGLTIDHLCRVPACVNPAHLEAVTQRENILRSPIAAATINAQKTHCKHGHEFTPANTLRVGPDGRQRSCRACAYRMNRESAARRRARQEADLA